MEIFNEKPKHLRIAKDRLLDSKSFEELSHKNNYKLVEIPKYFIPVSVLFNGKTVLVHDQTPYDLEIKKPKWNNPEQTIKVRLYSLNDLFQFELFNLQERKKTDVETNIG